MAHSAERRFHLGICGASLLHAGLLLCIARWHHVPVASFRHSHDPVADIELTLVTSNIDRPTRTDFGQEPNIVRHVLATAKVKAPVQTARSPAAREVSRPESVLSTSTLMTSSSEQESTRTPNESSAASPSKSVNKLNHPALHSIGNGDDFALAYAMSGYERSPDPAAAAEGRLQQSMQQAQIDRDRKIGLGVPAQLILSMEAAAREVAIPTNSTALFTVSIDGSGNLFAVEFEGSNHASPQWDALSKRVLQSLHGRRLSISKNTKGVDFKLRLEARSQLPSGRDPGMEVNLLGIPIKKGQGKRSGKISILDLKPRTLEYVIGTDASTQTVKVPVPGILITPIAIAGDPSDIGAPARHMIRIHVLDEKIY